MRARKMEIMKVTPCVENVPKKSQATAFIDLFFREDKDDL